jgi:hypothetical protein
MEKKRLSINVTQIQINQFKNFSGANILYLTRKGNSFILLDMKLLDNKATDLKIVTNNARISRFYDKPFMVLTDRLSANMKFRITKFLTATFAVLPVPIKVRNKYYCRIRDLLVTQYKSIINRQKSLISNNRETHTYIKFLYKHLTWYLCFWVLCYKCSNPCAVVLSCNCKGCVQHKHELLDLKYSLKPQTQDFNIRKHEDKIIVNNHSKTVYNKQVIYALDKRFEIHYSDFRSISTNFSGRKEAKIL